MGHVAIDMTQLAQSAFLSACDGCGGAMPRFTLKQLPPQMGDLAMLRQVFANLIGNAVKFSSRQAAPVIEVGSVARSFADGASLPNEIVYYVKDNGAGFDEKYSHKLFGVFQRLHSEAEFEGTGVGLALVQRIVHRHGGKVWAKGEIAAGATFFFSLPAMNEGL
jgi:light-regulated signal transduction histidine kinase (bacteriophytochrome)